MKLKLYNTLTRKKETFKPLKQKRVGLYTCGPTVYGPGHLGHARSYTNFDFLKRVLVCNGFKVKHVLNITDVHDDMIKKANELGISIQELADRYIPLFKKDLASLNIIPANEYPRVTEYIEEIISFIQTLISRNYAYVGSDRSVYFDLSKFKSYGKLSGVKVDKAKTGTRVSTDKYEKDDVSDFVLWKNWKQGEPFWESPWGKGRPGWHIECSVMAKECLGPTIDIHGGAMDLKFPHHENEIAQSEAANGVKFANYWFHAGLLDINGRKMSKSLGNYIEIKEVKEKGFNPLSLRYLFLTAHYRSRMNFTWKALEGARNSLEKLQEKIREAGENSGFKIQNPRINKKYKERFLKAINNDLNMPQALALTWELLKDNNIPDKEKYGTVLGFDKILGLKLDKVKRLEVPEKIKELVRTREKLRQEKKFKQADKIRKEIEKMGYEIEDTKNKPKIKKRN